MTSVGYPHQSCPAQTCRTIPRNSGTQNIATGHAAKHHSDSIGVTIPPAERDETNNIGSVAVVVAS